MSNQKKTTVLIIYIVVFYALWTAFELIVKGILDSAITNINICQFVKSGIIKNLVWTLPAVMLVKNFKDDVHIPLKEMFRIREIRFQYLYIFILFTIYLFVGSLLQKGQIAIVHDFGADEIIIVLFVGLTEEMVFRGWLLNATIREEKKWKYVIINAIMFLVIHFPGWIYKGIFISSFTGFGFISVLVLSIIFSWTFIKSRNILIPIALHMYWDLLMFMLY